MYKSIPGVANYPTLLATQVQSIQTKFMGSQDRQQFCQAGIMSLTTFSPSILVLRRRSLRPVLSMADRSWEQQAVPSTSSPFSSVRTVLKTVCASETASAQEDALLPLLPSSTGAKGVEHHVVGVVSGIAAASSSIAVSSSHSRPQTRRWSSSRDANPFPRTRSVEPQPPLPGAGVSLRWAIPLQSLHHIY